MSHCCVPSRPRAGRACPYPTPLWWHLGVFSFCLTPWILTALSKGSLTVAQLFSAAGATQPCPQSQVPPMSSAKQADLTGGLSQARGQEGAAPPGFCRCFYSRFCQPSLTVK